MEEQLDERAICFHLLAADEGATAMLGPAAQPLPAVGFCRRSDRAAPNLKITASLAPATRPRLQATGPAEGVHAAELSAAGPHL